MQRKKIEDDDFEHVKFYIEHVRTVSDPGGSGIGPGWWFDGFRCGVTKGLGRVT